MTFLLGNEKFQREKKDRNLGLKYIYERASKQNSSHSILLLVKENA